MGADESARQISSNETNGPLHGPDPSLWPIAYCDDIDEITN